MAARHRLRDSGRAVIQITVLLFVLWTLPAAYAPEAASKAGYEKQWKNLVAAARKEGRLTLIAPTEPNARLHRHQPRQTRIQEVKE